MTRDEILEYNKKCAAFLDWTYVKDGDIWNPDMTHDYSYVYSGNLRFHSDWNWIMEVVEKIQTLDKFGGIVMIQQGRCKITSRMAGDNTVYADVSHYYLYGMKKQKEAVVQAIDNFLNWYNEKS